MREVIVLRTLNIDAAPLTARRTVRSWPMSLNFSMSKPVFALAVGILLLVEAHHQFRCARTPPSGHQQHIKRSTPRFIVTILPDLPGFVDGSVATAINNRREVVGYAYQQEKGRAAIGPNRAFVFSRGRMHDLGSLDVTSAAYGINNTGEIVGECGVPSGLGEAAVWKQGTLHRIAALRGSVESTATGVNAHGEAVGFSQSSKGVQSFLYSGNRLIEVSIGGDSAVWAAAINDHGVIVGKRQLPESGTIAFKWQNGRGQDLALVGGKHSVASAVNNTGNVVGDAQTESGAYRACLWRAGKPSILGTLGGVQSSAKGINVHDEVVGYSEVVGSSNHRAVLWSGGQIYDLNLCISPQMDTVIEEANGINEQGDIVGQAIVKGRRRGFVLSRVLKQ